MKTVFIFLITGFLLSFSPKKHKKFIPPGTVQIYETFFADETEVSNLSWGEYVYWISTKYGPGSKEHLEVLPDTLVWKNIYDAPYGNNYYRHPKFWNYPVVGITYEQALAFCKWRTDRVKEYYSIANKKDISVAYRLPTRQEWELLSNNGSDLFHRNGFNEKGQRRLNCLWTDTTNVKKSGDGQEDLTAPVYSYWKNHYGLYNMFGNVSEMISEKGISKGGGWRHGLEACRAGKDLAYSKPEAWLGFRCVCDVISPS